MCSLWQSENDLTPDYRIKGIVVRKNAEPTEFDYHSFHHSESPNKNSFYDLLFNGNSAAKYMPSLPDATPNSLKGYLDHYLPEYMVPSAYVFLKSLPRTPNGKVDRCRLPASTRTRIELDSTYVAPRTSTERTISSIWKKLLNVAKVGVNDNFFDLGGHSLLMVRLRNELREALNVQPTIIDLFRYPTIGTLAKYLSERNNQAERSQQLIDQDAMQKAVTAQERPRK
jgi:acyl carrier protein